jgi:hypothetical protein
MYSTTANKIHGTGVRKGSVASVQNARLVCCVGIGIKEIKFSGVPSYNPNLRRPSVLQQLATLFLVTLPCILFG